VALQRGEWAKGNDIPTRSHHFFSGLPYHHVLGKAYEAARMGTEFRRGDGRRPRGLTSCRPE
jgi:hypothetical protein